mgnify:CR=1 FL=1
MSVNGLGVTAIIPARRGSKGLPNKCVYPLNGVPLIEYTIRAALTSDVIDDVVVTTDSAEAKAIACSYGLSVIDRPAHLATDEVGTQEVLEHAISHLDLKVDSLLVLLQPTSPLRAGVHVDAALSRLCNDNVRGVYSVSERTEKPLKAFIENDDGFLVGLAGPGCPFMRRQDLPKAYFSNGAIYIFYVGDFLKAKYGFDIANILPYVMGVHESIDIDDIEDLQKAEKILQERGIAYV